MLAVHSQRRGRRGLTLTELVIVLVILAATAMLVIPRLGFLKDFSDESTSAAGASQLMSNLEIYQASTGGNPQGLDSLLANVGSTIYSGVPTDLYGVTVGTLSPAFAESLRGSFASSTGAAPYVYDHDLAATYPSDSGTIKRTLQLDGSDKIVLVTSPTLIQAFGYPTGSVPSDTILVAMGVGPNSSLSRVTMMGAPLDTRVDSNQAYARYIAVFAVYDSARPAELKGVLTPALVTSYVAAAPPTTGGGGPVVIPRGRP